MRIRFLFLILLCLATIFTGDAVAENYNKNALLDQVQKLEPLKMVKPEDAATKFKNWDRDCLKVVKYLMEHAHSEMDVWRGSMPMDTPEHFKAYVDTFDFWARLIKCKKPGDVVDFWDKVVEIQREALPKLRMAYARMIFANSGFNPKDVELHFDGTRQQSVHFIWVGEFSPPPDFVTAIYQESVWLWRGLRFSSVKFSKRSSTTVNLKIKEFWLFSFLYNQDRSRKDKFDDRLDGCLIEWLEGGKFVISDKTIRVDDNEVREW